MLAGASVVLAGLVLPARFAAAEEAVDRLYVDRWASCSDSGPGSAQKPFCTISAAAKVVLPGQTVVVAEGTYQESVQLTRSGTPEQPITFVSKRLAGLGGQNDPYVSPRNDDSALSVSGVENVVIRGLTMVASGPPVVIKDSARITLDQFDVKTYEVPSVTALVHLTGTTSQVTLSRSTLRAWKGDAVRLDSGVHDTVITTNYIFGTTTAAMAAVSATDASGTVVTSNTMTRLCGPAVRLAGASTGATLRNNIAATDRGCAEAGKAALIEVADQAVPGTTVDYSVVHPADSAVTYRWGTGEYRTPAELQTARSQGAHDLLADPKTSGWRLGADSPAIDSADSTAPGLSESDKDGYQATDHPGVPNTGTGKGIRDRGASELQGVDLPKVTLVGGYRPYPSPVTATGRVLQNWPAPLTYAFDFGDGSPAVVSDRPTADHVYTRAGRFVTTMTVTNPEGLTYQARAEAFTVSEPVPPVAAFTVERCAKHGSVECLKPLSYWFDTGGSTSSWPIESVRFDFGDGTSETYNLLTGFLHTYDKPGDYQVTLTITNKGGEKAVTTRTVSVSSRPSGYAGRTAHRVADTRSASYGTPRKLGPGEKLILDLEKTQATSWDATAVVLNITAVNAAGAGFLSAGPGNLPQPSGSSLNYTAGAAVANLVTVPVGSDFKVAVWNSPGGSPVDVLVDMQGEYTPRGTDLYAPLQPARIMDTRDGTGTGSAGKISPQCGMGFPPPRLQVRGVNGVPSDATDVVLNLTVTEPEQDGNLSSGVTYSSALNFQRGQTVSNQVVAHIDTDGTIAFCANFVRLHLIADLFGYYAPSGQNLFVATDPTRMLDSRVSPGKLAPYSQVALRGFPAGASAAVLNLTATEPAADGYLAAYPGGTVRPNVSNVNFRAGQTVATHATVPIGADGTVNLYNHNGSTHVIADSSGYFVRK